jgi:hypothetical protein
MNCVTEVFLRSSGTAEVYHLRKECLPVSERDQAAIVLEEKPDGSQKFLVHGQVEGGEPSWWWMVGERVPKRPCRRCCS